MLLANACRYSCIAKQKNLKTLAILCHHTDTLVCLALRCCLLLVSVLLPMLYNVGNIVGVAVAGAAATSGCCVSLLVLVMMMMMSMQH